MLCIRTSTNERNVSLINYSLLIKESIFRRSSSDTSSCRAKNDSIDFSDPAKNVLFTSFITRFVYSSLISNGKNTSVLPPPSCFLDPINPLFTNIFRNVAMVE